MGQLEGPGLANKNIQQDGLSPKTPTEQILKMSPARFRDLYVSSQCPPNSSSNILLSKTYTPSLQSLCLSGPVIIWGSVQLSFLGLSSLPSCTPHTMKVGPSPPLQLSPGPAKPCQPHPSHTPAGAECFTSQQAEAPEAFIMSYSKPFWKQVRGKV